MIDESLGGIDFAPKGGGGGGADIGGIVGQEGAYLVQQVGQGAVVGAAPFIDEIDSQNLNLRGGGTQVVEQDVRFLVGGSLFVLAAEKFEGCGLEFFAACDLDGIAEAARVAQRGGKI